MQTSKRENASRRSLPFLSRKLAHSDVALTRLAALAVSALALSAVLAPLACKSRPGSADGAAAASVVPSATLREPPSTTSQPGQPAEAVPRAAHPHFLWEVSSPVATAYLLGSVHVARADTYPLANEIETAFARAKTLVLEVDLGGSKGNEAAKKMMSLALYATEDSLQRHVDAETYGELQRHLEMSGQPANSMDRLRPWFVSLTLTLLELQAHGFSAQRGIDDYFRARAEGHKRVLSLETIDEQVTLFSKLDKTTGAQALRQALDELPTVEATMNQAVAMWKRGDTQGVEDLLVEPVRQQYPLVYEHLLAARNKRMAAKVEELLRSEDQYFIVVGAAHLVGKDGIIELMKRKGRVPVQR